MTTDTLTFEHEILLKNMNGEITPEVGMPATLTLWSDKLACDVTKVTGSYIELTDRETGTVRKCTLRDNNRYTLVGCKTGRSGSVLLGVAESYFDRGF